MNTFEPKVSIITICLNSGKYMESTIQNVRSQTYANIEYVVIDGGSRDSTQEILKAHDKDIDYWISEPDKGISDAFNKGVRASTGEIIAFLNNMDSLDEKDAQIREIIVQSLEKERRENLVIIIGFFGIILGIILGIGVKYFSFLHL